MWVMYHRENRLLRVYRANIGEPTDVTDVYGYWLFVTGLVLATVGIGVFLWGSTYPWGDPNFWTLREAGMALAALGLPLGLLGATFRLPLQPVASAIGGFGLLLSGAGTVWFVALYPFAWPTVGPTLPILTYTSGIVVLGAAYTVVPHIVTRERTAEEAAQTRQPYYELQQSDAGWMWQLFGSEGELLAESSSHFTDRDAARATIDRLATTVPTAGIEITVTEAN